MKKQKNYLNTFVLLEMLLSFILITVVVAVSFNMLKTLSKKNQLKFDETVVKLEFENFSFFLNNRIKDDKNLDKLIFVDNKILYNNSLLLDNVTKFKKNILNDYIEINLCLYTMKKCTNLVFCN